MLKHAREIGGIQFRAEQELDPVQVETDYWLHRWFVELRPIRTECYRCHAASPVVHVPMGVLAFGNPRELRQRGNYKPYDITNDVKKAFADVGWKFQLKRSYCPSCKGLGTV